MGAKRLNRFLFFIFIFFPKAECKPHALFNGKVASLSMYLKALFCIQETALSTYLYLYLSCINVQVLLFYYSINSILVEK